MVELIVIVLLIGMNGLFAMAEIAVVSSRNARLQQLASAGSAGAQAALDLVAQPERFLSTIQIGITLIGISAGALSDRVFTGEVSAQLSRIGTLAPYSDRLAFALVVVAVTYFTLVVGELVPKNLALQNPERLASLLSRLMKAVSRIGAPAVYVLSQSTRFVFRILGVQPSTEPPVTEGEIRVMLEQGAEAGVFEKAEHDIVKRIFKLGPRAVGAVMKPRRDVVWLDLEDPFEVNRKKIASSLFSRFPVGYGSLENVAGIVQTKELLTQCLAGNEIDLNNALRPPLFVPEGLPALRLLELFKKSRTHIALVVDEHGGVEGLVTLTDILEDLVGDVASVDMPQEAQAVQREDGSWLLDGRLSIDEVKEILRLSSLPGEETGGYQTLGGLVMLQAGRVPVTGDRFEYADHRFEVVDMDGKRVDKVLVSPLPPP